ncbi:MAG TPA: SDR family oxidoreductase [Candidatus Dormibacteraeota bacterium]|nr:SDR family oxidoreductase [Candidatus Dormibacteraeota bacterium]
MLLQNKTAIIYGGAGDIGSAVARAFAREGARLFLAGRTEARLRAVADDITAGGGRAEIAVVDATDREAVERHAAEVASMAGGIDVSFNAIGVRGDLQGTPLLEMSESDFMTPVVIGAGSNFLTAVAAGRHMVARGSGVILTMSATSTRLSGRDHRFHKIGGFGVACIAVESLTYRLAGEFGPSGVRAVCMRSDALLDSWPNEAGEPTPFRAYMQGGTMLDRMPRVAEVADTAAFLASDRAGAITGTVVNLSCGSVAD